jgi:hypothetical protein
VPSGYQAIRRLERAAPALREGFRLTPQRAAHIFATEFRTESRGSNAHRHRADRNLGPAVIWFSAKDKYRFLS